MAHPHPKSWLAVFNWVGLSYKKDVETHVIASLLLLDGCFLEALTS